MNPPEQRSAVALAYDAGRGAPRVVARGRGLLADEIIRRAQENEVFVHQSAELVALLMQVDLDREIPPALYQAIAELLAWLYRIDAGMALSPDAASQDDRTVPAGPA